MVKSVTLKVSSTSASEIAKADFTAGITGKNRWIDSGPISVIAPSAVAKRAPARFVRIIPPVLSNQARQLLFEDPLGLARDPGDKLARRRDVVDEAAILAHGEWRVVDVAGLAGFLHVRERLRLILP